MSKKHYIIIPHPDYDNPLIGLKVELTPERAQAMKELKQLSHQYTVDVYTPSKPYKRKHA